MLKQLVNIVGEELKYATVSSQYRISSGSQTPCKILVNGAPKTGTTWMVYLLKSIPGYQEVGNFKGQTDYYLQVQPGDVIHGHDRHTPELAKLFNTQEIKMVLMMRDPRDQIISHMYHIKRDTTHSWHERLTNLGDDEALMACIEGHPGTENGIPFLGGADFWFQFAQEWLRNQTMKIHPVKYEDLRLNPLDELNKVFQYLGIKATDTFIQSIIERNRFERLSVEGWRIWQAARKPGQTKANSHFRKGITGDWKNHFKEAHSQRFKKIAGEKLIEFGYEKNLDW